MGLSLGQFEYCHSFLWGLGVGNLVRSQEGRSWCLVVGDVVGFQCKLWRILRLYESSSSEYGAVPIAVLDLVISAFVTGV